MWSPKGWSKNGQDSRSHETEDGEKIAATITNHCKSYQKARIWNLLKWLANMMNSLKHIII